MTKQELAAVLASHSAWLRREDCGVRANLKGANLTESNLTDAYLMGVSLWLGNRRIEVK